MAGCWAITSKVAAGQQGAAVFPGSPPRQSHQTLLSALGKGCHESAWAQGRQFSHILRVAKNLDFLYEIFLSEMLETNAKCFGYYTGQITHICGPDATPEFWFATSGADPSPNLREGEMISSRDGR